MANERLEQEYDERYESARRRTELLRGLLWILAFGMFIAMSLNISYLAGVVPQGGKVSSTIATMSVITTAGAGIAFSVLAIMFLTVPDKWEHLPLRYKVAAAIAIVLGLTLFILGSLMSDNTLGGIGNIGSELSAAILGYGGVALIIVVAVAHFVHVYFQPLPPENHAPLLQDHLANEELQIEGQLRRLDFPGAAFRLDPLPREGIPHSGAAVPPTTGEDSALAQPGEAGHAEEGVERKAVPPAIEMFKPQVLHGPGSPRFMPQTHAGGASSPTVEPTPVQPESPSTASKK